MRTDTPTFVGLLVGVVVLVGALTFFPALLLGPVVQGLTDAALLSMKRNLITSALAVIVVHGPARARLSARHHRDLAGRVRPARPTARRSRRRQGRRLAPDRQATSTRQEARPALLPAAAVADGLQRRRRRSSPTAGRTRPRARTSTATSSRPTSRSSGRYNPGLTNAKVPVDAVTTSASGVDPHISQANAAHPGAPRRRRARAPARPRRRSSSTTTPTAASSACSASPA